MFRGQPETLYGAPIWRGPSPGITYFIATEPYSGWVKIGRSAAESPEERLASGQCWSPYPLVVRAVLNVDIEQDLHALYRKFRGCGEWFALPAALSDRRAIGKAAKHANPLQWFRITWPVDAVVRDAGGYTAARSAAGFARRFASATVHDQWARTHAFPTHAADAPLPFAAQLVTLRADCAPESDLLPPAA